MKTINKLGGFIVDAQANKTWKLKGIIMLTEDVLLEILCLKLNKTHEALELCQSLVFLSSHALQMTH